MKKLLFLLLMLPMFVVGQDTIGIARLPVDPVTKIVTYKQTYQLSGVKKDSVFVKIKEWLVYNYRAQSSPIQLEDLAKGRIMARGQKAIVMVVKAGIAGNIPTPSTISYVLTFNIRSEEFDVVLDSFANNYNGNTLPVEQGFSMFNSIKKTKQTIKLANDIADNINHIAKGTLSDIQASIK